RFAGIPWPGGPAYHEVGMAIPFVTRRGGHSLHLYMAGMYASYPPAVWAGNLYFGFSKEVAQVHWDGALCVVTLGDGSTVFRADVKANGEASTAGFERVRGLFRLPVFGRRADGSLACSLFDWDSADALVRPARITASVRTTGERGRDLLSRETIREATFSV